MEPESSVALQCEQLFRDLFANHAAVSLLVDAASGRIIDANEAAAAYYGWTRDTLRRMSIQQINTLPPESLRQAMAQVASCQQYRFEFQHRRADSSIRDVEVYASRVAINGQSLLFSIVHDVTDRKRAEAELRQQAATLAQAKAEVENEQRLLSAVLDALPTGVAITNRQGGPLLTNAGYERIWGGPIPETASVADYAAYKAWWDDTGEPVAPEEWASAIATRTGQAAIGQMMRLQRFDGSELHVINSAAPVYDRDGQLVGCAVAIQDITELKRVEQALRQSEERHRLLAETMLHGVVHHDAEGRIIAVNRAAETIIGRSREELLGRTSVEAVPNLVRENGAPFPAGERPELLALASGQAVRGVVVGVFNPRAGARRWIRMDAVPVLNEGGARSTEVFIVFEDVTERKLAEEALRTQERTLRALFDAAGESIWLVNLEGVVLAANETAARRLGKKSEEVIGSRWQTLVPADLVALRTEKANEILRTGRPVAWEDRRGTLFFEHSAYPVRDDQGTIAAIALFSRDVSERKAAEEALRRSDAQRRAVEQRLLENEARFRLALDAASNGVWDCNLETGGVFRGENWHCTLGYDRALPAAEDDLFASLIHPDDLARERAERRAHLQGRTERYEVEYRLRSQAGEWRWMLSRGRVVERDANGRALRFIGTITDITRLKEAEAALQRGHAELEQRVRERTVELSESNVALTVLLKKREQDRAALAEQVLANAGNLLEPFLDRLQDCRLNDQQRVLVDILRANLRELTAPFAGAFSSKMARLTPAEMQVANLIKLGKRSKEIAEILHLSPGTVNVHRKNIRKKLDIDHQKANLQTLLTMQD